MKFLFIDGNNLGVRHSFANKDLGVDFIDYTSDFNPDETLQVDNHFPTGAIHGFFRTILSLKKMYPDRYICVVWDGKSKARMTESREAVAKGIVPQAYKENRSSAAMPVELANFHRQKPLIISALSMTNIPQVAKSDEEADDVIASFVSKFKGEDILILTNDHDYYQLFDEHVSILDASGTVLTEKWFRNSFGIAPSQWIDVGALMGDSGDNIFGIPWWGEATAVREVARHGGCEAVLKELHLLYDPLRVQHPDLNAEEFTVLKDLKRKDEKPKFPGVKQWMPFTGVALAYDSGKVKIPKDALMALVYESRVPLAKSLKAMRRSIPLPRLPVDLGRNKMDEFASLCQKYSLRETEMAAATICARQCGNF